MTTDAIRPMRADDVAAAIAVSADADQRFLDVDDPRIAGSPDLPWTEDELLAYVDAERGWVATEDDVVVGFAVVLLLDGVPHIEEISVARSAGRRGLGTRLLRTVHD